MKAIDEVMNPMDAPETCDGIRLIIHHWHLADSESCRDRSDRCFCHQTVPKKERERERERYIYIYIDL